MGKLAFLFSGQGDQKVGMGKALHDASAAAGRVFAAADLALPFSASKLCFEGPQEALNQTLHTQGCVLAVDLAVAAALQENGIRPEGVAGFSLGEMAALQLAGVYSLEDAFALTGKRAAYMQEACQATPGGMAACIGASAQDVESLCQEVGGVWAVNYNCPGQTVVAGHQESLETFVSMAKERKLRAVPLSVSGAFHTELMASAAERLAADLESVATGIASIPVYGNTDAAPYPNDPQAIRAQYADQLRKPVRWEATIRRMVEDGFDTFIECGPGGTLTGFFKRMKLEDVRAMAVNDPESLQAAVQALS